MRPPLWLLSALAFVCVPANADNDYLPASRDDHPTSVYWGDTHLHTRNSADAFSLGNMNLSPADAYRFARGQELRAHNGMKVRLRRPLDFLVVSDHAEYLGGHFRYAINDTLVMGTEVAKGWREQQQSGNLLKMVLAFSDSIDSDRRSEIPVFPKDVQLEIWRDVALTSDEYDEPGEFTALKGYEWTAMRDGNNLHRVVVFADDISKTG